MQGCNGPRAPEAQQHSEKVLKGHKIPAEFYEAEIKKPIFLYVPWTSSLCSKEQTKLFYQFSLPEADASPAFIFRIQDPIFTPGHGFELRGGGILGVWIFTQGCANPSPSEAISEASLARLVLLFITPGWLTEPLAVLMLQDHLGVPWSPLGPLLAAREGRERQWEMGSVEFSLGNKKE